LLVANKDYFQGQLEEIKRQPEENIIACDFRLKNIFEHVYPKTACTTQAEEDTRLEMLRQKFLTGLDGPLKNKVRYKEFKDYEEFVRETDKYDNRLLAEKEEISKREFVNAVTSTVSPSDSQLLWAAIDNIRNKQSETVGAIASSSCPTAGEAEPTISSSGFDMLRLYGYKSFE
jgi:NCAIR mutase (PurE)-related protein